MLSHANSKVMSIELRCETLHVGSNAPTRLTFSLARLLARCECFVMVTHSCYHMPVWLCNIVIEHGVGTQRFCSNLCSGFHLVSFPLGRTSALGLELGTWLWCVDWITGEIAPLSAQTKLKNLVASSRVGDPPKMRRLAPNIWKMSTKA